MQRQTKVVNELLEANKKQQKELDEEKRLNVENDNKIKVLTFQYHRHIIQSEILIKRDMAYTSRHKTLSDATEQLHIIVAELVELLAAQGENTSLQVQAQCKLDELKKIQDDLDTDKDPNASQQREQPSGSQATEAVTNVVVEGESQRGEVASGDKGPTEVELSILSDSDHDLQAGEHFISNDDLDKDDEVVGIVEEL
ncbi:hypothetical protein Hanom_Chr06g00508841 [Helianthus anomalus]